MAGARVAAEETQQRVKDARVSQVDLGRLDLALGDVLEPGLKLANHEGPGQDVEVGADRLVAEPHGTAEFGGVPALAVEMGDHGPEATHRDRGNRDSELWNITLEKGADEALPPGRAVGIRLGQVGAREAPAQPQPARLLGAGLSEVEAGQLDQLDPPGQRFRHPPHNLWRGAAEDEKSGACRDPIRQHAQHGEQFRDALDLVENDETLERTERQFGLGQSPAVKTGFEIKEGAAVRGGERACERGLAALARTEEGGDGGAPDGGRKALDVAMSRNLPLRES